MRRWGVKLSLYWCPNCNVPLRQRVCDRCGSEGFEVSVSEPGDIRPAFKGDVSLVRESMINEFGNDALYNHLIVEGAVYLNKTPHVDDMREVISGSAIVGRLYFDPSTLTWRWRLNRLSAPIAADLGLIKVFKCKNVRPLMDLGEGSREGEQALVTDLSGNPIALAVTRRGRFRVQSIFKEPLGRVLKKPSSFVRFAECNSFWLRTRLSKSIKSLAIMHERTGLKPVVSYSGGKDSLVTLHLALRSGLEPDILFNDTGIELPQTIANVEEVSRKFGLELVLASAGDLFWHSVERFGPPAREYRWCCKVVKLGPIAKTYKGRYPNGLLAIIGQRAYESVDRSRSGYIWRNRWLPSALNIAPIQEWDQLTVWTYIIMNKLPVNELYFRGFERLGCYLCPAGNLAEYTLVSRECPELWMRWVEFLERWRSRLGEREEWVKYHLWRWLNPLAQGRRRLELWLGMKEPSNWRETYSRHSGISASVSILEKGGEAEIEVRLHCSIALDLRIVREYSCILGLAAEEGSDSAVVVKGRQETYRVNSLSIEAQGRISPGKLLERCIDIVKLAVRVALCCSCGLCETWCPTGATSIVKGVPKVNPGRCIGCGACLEVCPLSAVFAERLITPQLINNPRGRSRKRFSIMLELERLRRARAISESRHDELDAKLEGISTFLESIS